MVKIMKALVNIHTASPGPSIVLLPRWVVGNSVLINVKASVKIEELVGGSSITASLKNRAMGLIALRIFSRCQSETDKSDVQM